MIKNVIIAVLAILLIVSVVWAQSPPAGWVLDANGTDGTDLQQMIIVNEISGERIPISEIPDLAAFVTQQNNIRQTVIDLASPIVGVDVRDLTTTQQKIMLGLLLYRAGAIDSNLDIRPLGEWME